MKHLSRYILYVVAITTLGLTAACTKKLDDEITSLEFSRLFSPTELSAIVVNKTGVRLGWAKVTKAQTYQVELFANANLDFSGTPAKTIKDITFDQVPYTVTGLDGETDYSVRVKAVGTDIDDSKWIAVKFKTDAEQIFTAIDPADLQATQVTLRWPANSVATSIVLTPGNVTHTLTSTELAAGAATLTGLLSETTYTAVLKNNTKTRGTVTFTTLLDLGGATALEPTDDVATILQSAAAGSVFALMPGTYTLQNITLRNSISVKGARPASKPILNGVVFKLAGGAGLQLKDLVMDGATNTDGNQAVVYDEDLTTGTYGELKMEDCVIRNYVKGLVYVNKKALIETMTIKGNIIYNIECNGGDFVDFRTGLAKTFSFTNNTVYNSALTRDFFRMDAGGSTNFPGNKSMITISNNTLYRVANTASNRLLYIRLASNDITFTKNMVVSSAGYFTTASMNTVSTISGNNYFEAAAYSTTAPSGGLIDKGSFTKEDPAFTNANGADFTVGNLVLKNAGVGDPRWIK